jgi:hypothetical protein
MCKVALVQVLLFAVLNCCWRGAALRPCAGLFLPPLTGLLLDAREMSVTAASIPES